MRRRAIVGIIAEDESDVAVLVELLRRLASKPNFGWEKFVGDGCAKVRSKLIPWSRNLFLKGCNCLLVVHDLDRNDLSKLTAELTEKAANCGITERLVLIPVEELEAWLLSDMIAIRLIFDLQKGPKEITHPQKISSPKEHLRGLVKKWSANRRDYLNTRHNKKIAEKMDLGKLLSKCPSFQPLRTFAQANL